MAQTPAKTAAKSTAKTAKAKPAAAKAKAPAGNTADAKQKFTRAIEEAKAGAAALTAEARERATAKSSDWVDEAKVYGEQAKAKAGELAVEGKARASDAIAGLGKLVEDNASTIDDRLGTKYGDYARSASRKMKETAEKIDAKNLDELGEDAREMVRKSPGLAVGIAAVAGFLVARLFSSSK